MSDFDDAFSAADEAAEAVMGESFSFGGRDFPAISIEPVTFEMRAMPGGKYADANTVIYVRAAVVLEANLQPNKEIIAKGEALRVMRIENDTPGSRGIVCGSAGVRMPSR